MKKSRVLMSAATLAGVCLVGASLSGFAVVDTDATNAEAAVAAVENVAPDTVSDVATPSTTDPADAVHVATPQGGSVHVPKVASSGVKVTTLGNKENVTIGLPFASKASHATASQEADVVVYNNNNGSSTVPVPHMDGSVQISTVISNAKAPKRYDYPIQVPKGASLVRSAKGVVAVATADGAPIMVFGDAWAKDANGNPVPTHYEVKKNTLTQVVEFSAQTAFPVVADPQTTGVYSYNCVNPNGSSYFMRPNENLTNCKGSYLQKYINGRMVQSVALVYRGGASVKVTWKSGCILALGTTAASLVFSPPTGGLAWVVTGAVAAAGISQACKGF
ncbi:hypothetical protein [Leifsonia sp. 22587]|uniref:hypothetical protein n=1 Tax=Leifsonia sp. 22587 TaxID=3453946 RepID=UPI003F85237D